MNILRRLRDRLRRRGRNFATVKYDDGSVMVMDPTTVDYLQSTAPDPTQASLDEQLDAATRVRVIDGGMQSGKPLGKKVLVDTTDPADLATVRRSLRIVEDSETFGHCMCLGDLTIQLYDGKQLLATLGFHHGRSIRWDAWKHDALLVDGMVMLDWLAEGGVTGPKQAYESAQQEAEESRQAVERWQEAMPACLAPFWGEMIASAFVEPVDVDPMMRALAIEFPDWEGRVLALLHWYGHGKGPWNGYPSYEDVAEALLLACPTQEIIAALGAEGVTTVHLEGAARHFTGWYYGQYKGGEELANIPKAAKEAVRKKLLAHCLQSGDRDKIRRGKQVFGRRAGSG